MSASASKGHKRTDVYWELEKAARDIQAALDKLATAGEVLVRLGMALKRTQQAGKAAQATTLEWEEKGKKRSKTKRDALPAGIRRRIAREGGHIEQLMELVRAIPVTQDEKALKKVKRGRYEK